MIDNSGARNLTLFRWIQMKMLLGMSKKVLHVYAIGYKCYSCFMHNGDMTLSRKQCINIMPVVWQVQEHET